MRRRFWCDLKKKKKSHCLYFFGLSALTPVMGWVALRANNGNGLGLMAKFGFNSRIYPKKKKKKLSLFIYEYADFLSICTIKLKLLTFFDLLRVCHLGLHNFTHHCYFLFNFLINVLFF